MVPEFIADVNCVFCPSLCLLADFGWKFELLLESFPARADSGLEAALLPVSSLCDCAALNTVVLLHIEGSGD